MRKNTRNKSSFSLLDKPTTAAQRHQGDPRSKACPASHANSRCKLLTEEPDCSIELECLQTIFRQKGRKRNWRRGSLFQPTKTILLKPSESSYKNMRDHTDPSKTQSEFKDTRHTISLISNHTQTKDVRFKTQTPVQSSGRGNWAKKLDDDVIAESLHEIKMERLYHKKFMEYISRKYVEKYPEKLKALRRDNAVQRKYADVAFKESSEKPRYLTVQTSFYSRSRKKCFHELPKKQQRELRREWELEKKEKTYKSGFSYFKYVADARVKKKFESEAKGKRREGGSIILTKSKDKILSMWKVGSQNQLVIKDFIEQILEERRNSLNFS